MQLKAEISRLRAECNQLTAAVDHYQDSQNNLPLGETDEEFYRNIYTGQRLQSELTLYIGHGSFIPEKKFKNVKSQFFLINLFRRGNFFFHYMAKFR